MSVCLCVKCISKNEGPYTVCRFLETPRVEIALSDFLAHMRVLDK